MCETSNTPQAWRTALCSSMMLVYWIGMSNPPKELMTAPRALCRSYKQVFLFPMMIYYLRCGLCLVKQQADKVVRAEMADEAFGHDCLGRSAYGLFLERNARQGGPEWR